MSDVVRSDYPAKPSNPPQSMGAVANIGREPGQPAIRSEYPAKPVNPQASQGNVPNVGGGTEKPVVRGGSQ